MTGLTTHAPGVQSQLVAAGEGIAADLQADRRDAALARLRPILRPELLRELIDLELRALLDGSPAPTKRAPEGELRLSKGGTFDMRVRVVRPDTRPPQHIKTLTRPTLIGNAGAQPFVVRRWWQPEPFPNDLFDARKTIEVRGEVTLGSGEAMALRAGYDAYEIAAGERSAVVVTVAAAHAVSLTWMYRRDTGRPVRVEPVARDWLRVQELLTFADALEDPSLVPAIAQLAEHPSHFVRWAAAKSTLRLAPEAANETLRSLANDPHAHVRSAARQLLGEHAVR